MDHFENIVNLATINLNMDTNSNYLSKTHNYLNLYGGAKIEYPLITDDNFQKQIEILFKKYKIVKKLSFKDICFPLKFTYQQPQLFVADFMSPRTPYKGLLLFHKIGAGKTCAAVNIAEKWKHLKKIFFICPASLIGNVYKELRSQCAGEEYISKQEQAKLENYDLNSDEYDNLINKIHKRIDKHYNIMSYNKFVSLSQKNMLNLENSILIIDEVQNIVSERGTFYHTFLNEIKNGPKNMKIIIMSATPIFDKPVELALTINLLNPSINLPIGSDFNSNFLKQTSVKNHISYEIKNMFKLKKMLSGYVSYYQGAPSYVFPRKIIKIVKCRMSNYQYSIYKAVEDKEGTLDMSDILKLPNNFFIGSRMVSNIAFPERKTNELGYESFRGNALKPDGELKKYSIKFYKILKNVKKCEGTVFIYSNFREYGGIQSFIKVLEANGFKNFLKKGEGKNRFAIWSGDEDNYEKEYIKNVFNKKQNMDGSNIKIMLGSPAIKEGVSLLRVQQVHIMEPYWNMSRLEQVIGRAIRFCSHKDVPTNKREVKVYIYIATDANNKKLTVDRHILNMAYSKEKLTNSFEKIIKESAVDLHLFQET